MPASNYVIKDMIQYIEDEREYRPRKSMSQTWRNVRKNFWLFFLIIGLSCGVGYLAVFLPDTLEQQTSAMLPSAVQGQSVTQMREKFNSLSEEQKAQLMQQFGGLK